MIELRGITKSYDNKIVLNEINLSVPVNKTTVVIGSSGCGKSTILKLILSLIKPDAGEILIDSKNINSYDIKELRRQFGYVIQEGGLFPHLTASENISLLPRYLRINESEINSRIQNLCELTKFPNDAIDRFPKELSGGQKQRVALMRALILEPRILLLDEPLGALDPLIRFELQNDLKEIFQKLGKTVVIVTHDLNEAEFFGDKIVLLEHGTVEQEGTYREFIDNPRTNFVRSFINAQRNE